MKKVLFAVVMSIVMSLPVSATDRLEALKQFMQTFQAQVNAGQVDLPSMMQPNVLVTFHNGQRVKGVEALQLFITQLTQSQTTQLTKFQTQLAVETVTENVRGTLVVQGATLDYLAFSDGLQFNLNSDWTAVLVWHGSGWRIAALHLSGNIFDNPVVDSASEGMQFAGMIGFLLGLVASWILYRTIRRQNEQYGVLRK